ncbi:MULTISPECIES: hypothetical protein [Kribbella]|uniref:Uncharacterized protein n=2 Tax=Kribbella TaxID=182639 RepID=A0A4R0JD19_9ACTN|nr:MULTISPECIES: hypothetical protein [Kribbella]TCC40591.1 hypothetical protein E0H92_02500 [Kribbella speibonae]TCC43384.1 hypothetical protein E0H50_02625 [Kribbella sindirgiensis]
MSRHTRRWARITAALLAVGVLLVPAEALAESIEPEPTDWPAVKPATGQAVEPQPVDWPTPTKT